MEISVIIPVRNEEQSIAQLLDSLIGQTVPPSEIVITDAGSTDGTTEIIARYATARVPVRLLRTNAALPGRARNLAAAEAKREWLAFIDAGVQPEPDWLQQLISCALGGADIDVVYGAYEPVVNTLFKQCLAIATLAPPRAIEDKLIRDRSITSALMKRAVWQQVGGFPEELRSAEDLLFMNKIDKRNFHIARAPDALVHWQIQATPWLTFKRFVTYARNNLRAGLWRQWQAAIFKRYALLLASALPVFWLGSKWLFVTMGLWLLMLAARALVAVWRNRFCYPANIFENALRLLVLVPLIALLDLATTVGTIQWLVKDKPGL